MFTSPDGGPRITLWGLIVYVSRVKREKLLKHKADSHGVNAGQAPSVCQLVGEQCHPDLLWLRCRPHWWAHWVSHRLQSPGPDVSWVTPVTR